MRQLVTVRQIDSIHPIPNADAIEVAVIGGWKAVIRKNQFQPQDKVAYFETDSLLPHNNPRYSDFQKHGQKTITINGIDITGHVLKTMKLRGQVSQGLVLSLEELGIDPETPIGTDITDKACVYKYEEPLPDTADIIGPFDTKFAPKTSSDRIQNLDSYWDEILENQWIATLKVDGSSHTLVNDDGTLRIFGRNWELDPKLSIGFKALPPSVVEYVSNHPGITVQFELLGPGIHHNRLKLNLHQVALFALYQNGEKIDYHLWPAELVEYRVPVLENLELSGTILEMIEKVTSLRENFSKNCVDEGVVFHLVQGKSSTDKVEPLWLNSNATFKIINNKYLLKHKL